MKSNKIKKTNIEYIVDDWNPNGTNDVTIVINGEVVETLEELTFGIDINEYNPEVVAVDDAGNEYFGASIPFKIIVEKLAVSPVTTASSQYQRLIKAVNQ